MQTSNVRRIALLEDDMASGETVKSWLEEAGYTVDWFKTGVACAKALEEGMYAACLLDWIVPELSGPQVMARIHLKRKEFPLPVVFLTSRQEESDIVQILAGGADDYIVKPVTRQLLLARMNSVLRRTGWGNENIRSEWGSLAVDFKTRRFFWDGIQIDLTERETTFALYLMQNVGRLLTRSHLLTTVWAQSADIDSRKVDVHASTLRRKLGLLPENGWRLVSIYGKGYRLEWLNGAS
jgi:DNA-binding response OmpR family regulator